MAVYEYKLLTEADGKILSINYEGSTHTPSIEDDWASMARVFDLILEVGEVNKVSFLQKEEYVYEFDQIKLINELTRVYINLVKEENVMDFYSSSIPSECSKYFPSWHAFLQQTIMHELKGDPVGAYVNLVRRFREEEAKQKFSTVSGYVGCSQNFAQVLQSIIGKLAQTELIKRVEKKLPGFKPGDRSVYREIFRPSIRPYFMYTKLVTAYPAGAEELASYKVGQNTDVMILRLKKDIRPLYHMIPPEFKLTEEKYDLLITAKEVMSEHRPQKEEFTDMERTRETFLNVEKDLIEDLAKSKGIKLAYKEIEELAEILLRYTIGFGLIEVLLTDPKIQDIVVNAPVGTSTISVIHADFGECETNITPLPKEAESWATKLRLISGRPFDEANPSLDASILVPGGRARVAAIQVPLSPSGLAFAFRRHRDRPWTLPLFIDAKMLTPLAAGFLSFIVDGARTILITGTRSSGKCVDGNTQIQLADGRIKKIKELLGKEKERIEDGIICEPSIKNIKVPSLMGLNLSSKRITDVWRRKSPEKVVKIKTKSGKEIVTTKEHPYFIYDGGMKNKRADNLKTEDLIASPRVLKINEDGKEIPIELKDKSQVINETDDFYILKGKTNSSVVKFPKKLNSEIAEFVGLIIGDGHIDSTHLEFHNSCKELRERYISLLKIFEVPYRVFKSHTTMVVQANSRVLSKTLSEVFEIPLGNKSDKVIIPSIILQSSNFVLASFLRGYFDTDGYCPAEKRDLELATASKMMCEHLKLALLRFGIIAFAKRRYVNGRPYYRILIRGEFANNFIEKIGFSHPFKKQRADLIGSKSFVENTNIDVIPQGNEIVKRLRQIFRASPQEHRKSGKDYWAYENNQYRVSRIWFRKIVDFYVKRHEKLLSMKSQAEVLRRLANFDLKDYFKKMEELRIESGISYNSLSGQVGLSERGVRKILQNQTAGSLETINKFSGASSYLKTIALDNHCKEACTDTEELSCEKLVSSSFIAGMILSEFRDELKISNDEFASAGTSSGSVSNLFNARYKTSIEVLRLLAKKAVDIYDLVISEENLAFLNKALELANSDIFWDEILSVEIIDRLDDFVYDLTVEDTHNFVANGLIAHNTSLLGAMMVELMRSSRVITVEDTLELPIKQLQDLNYDIQSLKSRSVITGSEAEVPAAQAIRTSLRLGDSALIVGEVRSEEAKALYEAMRVGALAKSVMGTIHGADPYGVFDRVVNDLGVPRTSFKATDIIVVCNPITSPSGMESWRRVTQITEVRKFWDEDPQKEKGFADLFTYDPQTDSLLPSDALIEGESEILKQIGGKVKEWAGDWDAIWKNIELRAKIKQAIVDTSKEINDPELMEADFVVKSNDEFHRITDLIIQDVGKADPDRIFSEWLHWLKHQIEERQNDGEE